MIGNIYQSYIKAFANLQRNIWVLSVSMLINRSGAMVLVFCSLYFTKDLSFSIEQAGLVMSFYGIGSVLGSFAGGWLTDRRDHLSIMMASLISSGCILFFLLLVHQPVAVAIVLFFYAFTADMFRPANSAAIAIYSTPENRTRSVSLVRLAVNLGFSVGPAMGGFIALYLGYKVLFVIDALTGFAAAAILYFYLPRQTAEEIHERKTLVRDKSTSAYLDKPYLAFILLVALYATAFFQLFASIPQYFSTVCHYSEDTIGLLLALNGFLVVVIEMPLISALESRARLFTWIVAGALCVPVSFLFLQFGNGLLIWALVYTLVITISEILAMPFMMNYSLNRPAKDRKGEYSALYSIAYGIANIAAPSLGLAIAGRFGFDVMFYFFIGISLVVAAGFYLLGHNHQAEKMRRHTLPSAQADLA